jgi:hypothetical protein
MLFTKIKRLKAMFSESGQAREHERWANVSKDGPTRKRHFFLGIFSQCDQTWQVAETGLL